MISGIKKKDFIKFKGIVYMVLSYEGCGLYRCVIMNGTGTGNIDLYAYETLCLGERVYSYEQLETMAINRKNVIQEFCEKIDDKDETIQSLLAEIEERKRYTKKVIEQRNHSLEEIDNKEEIIQSLHDEIEARNCYTQKVIAERNRLQEEMKLMVKDHEEECEDYCTMISERVNINDLHIILANYLTEKYTSEPTKIHLFQFLDAIKKYIDRNKEE